MTKKRYFVESELIFLPFPTQHQFQNLTGLAFGRLQVLGYAGKSPNGRTHWFCKCECGSIISIPSYSLKTGTSKSCGCLFKEILVNRNFKHGHCIRGNESRTYYCWSGMIQRCTNPKSDDFHNYGARGIKVCHRWRHSFKNFLEDMGECPESLTIERNNVNGNYEKSNCRWATMQEQRINKRNTMLFKFNGKSQTLGEWSIELSMSLAALTNRYYKMNWPTNKIFTTPVRKLTRIKKS